MHCTLTTKSKRSSLCFHGIYIIYDIPCIFSTISNTNLADDNNEYSKSFSYEPNKPIKKKKRRVPSALETCCIFEKNFGHQTGAEILANLQNEIRNNEHTMKMEILNQNNHVVISIVTPFMRRIQEKIKQSSEMVFMHSMGLSDSLKSHLYLLMTNSFIGGLPLGLIVTTSRSMDAIYRGLIMIRQLASESAFGGRGKLGPRLFMISDDNPHDRIAVMRVFPATRLLFCQSRMLKTTRNYIRDRLCITGANKNTLLMIFQSLMVESDENNFSTMIQKTMRKDIIFRFPKFRQYLQNLLAIKRNWAACYRTDLLTRGVDCNNLVSSALKKLKNNLGLDLAQSPIHLLKILSEDFENYYKTKITHTAHNRCPSRGGKIWCDLRRKCERLIYFPDSGKVLYSSHGRTYSVDHEQGLCNCPRGTNGRLCEHLFMVMSNIDNEFFLTLPESEYDYRKCYYIVTGKDSPDEKETDWYQPLFKPVYREPIGKVVKGMNVDQWLHGVPSKDTEIASVCEETVFVDPNNIKQETANEFTFEELDYVFTDLKIKISENPTLCASARKMLSAYKKISTINDLESALFSFAK